VVSATQYLVPNLTRGQLEEAIRKPIEKAAGTIEPELVERLINDCGDELDQLPVMQHCLMRLWDRAGAAAAEQGGRRLTRQTYEDIGRMAEALSRHADEILVQCAGKELAVEQAFRALSELDREGRAIRRALRFDKLLAETGVKESDLRAVLDRFRAPTCSFLLPSPSVSPMLAADDRVDIGHETLLRRWKKLAGETETVEARRGGWLGKEQADGQRYRTLVSLLEGDAGGEKATLTDPARTKAWWESLPRTAAWADRYGGNFDNVRTLIDDNIAAKQRSRRIRRRSAFLTAALVFAGVLAAGAWFVNEQSLRLQQGAIDGAVASTAVFTAFHYQDAAKYATETGQPAIFAIIEISKKWYDTLPPDLQQIVDQTAARESVAINPQALDITENSRKAWEAGGGELIKLPPDQQSTLLQMLSTVGADVSAQKPLLNSAYKIVSDAAQRAK